MARDHQAGDLIRGDPGRQPQGLGQIRPPSRQVITEDGRDSKEHQAVRGPIAFPDATELGEIDDLQGACLVVLLGQEMDHDQRLSGADHPVRVADPLEQSQGLRLMLTQ